MITNSFNSLITLNNTCYVNKHNWEELVADYLIPVNEPGLLFERNYEITYRQVHLSFNIKSEEIIRIFEAVIGWSEFIFKNPHQLKHKLHHFIHIRFNSKYDANVNWNGSIQKMPLCLSIISQNPDSEQQTKLYNYISSLGIETKPSAKEIGKNRVLNAQFDSSVIETLPVPDINTPLAFMNKPARRLKPRTLFDMADNSPI